METPSVEVKSMKMGARGLQVAIAVVPTNKCSIPLDGFRFRSGLSTARGRVLGHLAKDCRDVAVGKERCRRCGADDHRIEECVNKPKCAICSGGGVIGSPTSPPPWPARRTDTHLDQQCREGRGGPVQ